MPTDPPPDAKGAMAPDAPLTSPKLDAKNGFFGSTFGSKVKEIRGLRQTEKNGDRAAYKLTGEKTYSRVLLRDVTYTFQKGHLASIGFSVRAPSDCKVMAAALRADLGSPQKSASSPTEAYVWKGDKTGLRFAISSGGGCGGVAVSKDLAQGEWSGLEP